MGFSLNVFHELRRDMKSKAFLINRCMVYFFDNYIQRHIKQTCELHTLYPQVKLNVAR